MLQNGGLDIVAANAVGRASYRPLFDAAGCGLPNCARYVYCHDDARSFFVDWDGAADYVAAMLRVERARSPEQYSLGPSHRGAFWGHQHLVRAALAAYNVHDHRRGRKAIHHPDIDEIHLLDEALEYHRPTRAAFVRLHPRPGSPRDDPGTRSAGNPE